MVYIGVMRLNDLLYEALWTSSLMPYGEIDAAVDTQWHPLESIARDYKKGSMSKRSARKLFKKALQVGDFGGCIDYLTLEDALENDPNGSEAYAELSEHAHESGIDETWHIFTDNPESIENRGMSYFPFDLIEMPIKASALIIVKEQYAYFLSSDNIVEGTATTNMSDTVVLGGKVYPTREVSMRAVGEEEFPSPTYGPPNEIMELIKEEIEARMEQRGMSLVEVLEDADVYA